MGGAFGTPGMLGCGVGREGVAVAGTAFGTGAGASVGFPPFKLLIGSATPLLLRFLPIVPYITMRNLIAG